jgi:hypothetical protein
MLFKITKTESKVWEKSVQIRKSVYVGGQRLEYSLVWIKEIYFFSFHFLYSFVHFFIPSLHLSYTF